MKASRDPRAVFRQEAHEILEGLSIELVKESIDPETTARLMRLAHTLKGAAHVVGQEAMGDFAHVMEDVLAEHRESSTELSPQEKAEMLRIVGALRNLLAQMDEPAPDNVEKPAVDGLQTAESEAVRVDLSEVDSLTRSVAAAVIQGSAASSLTRELQALVRSAETVASRVEMLARSSPMKSKGATDTTVRATRDLAHDLLRIRQSASVRLDLLSRSLRTVRECSEELRLVAASSMFAVLERAVKAASLAADRQVRLILEGGDVRLDRRILQPLCEALHHLVRNAVDHGMEPAEERLTAGKPEVGTLRIRVERRADRIVAQCEDDGRGIDCERVRHAAVQLGMVSANEAAELSDDALLRLLLRPGMTTTQQVTRLSGRGVGLDVVRTMAMRMRGDVEVSTVMGQGTRVALVVPVSLSTILALELAEDGCSALVPLDAIEAMFRVPKNELMNDGDGVWVARDGHLVAFVPLSTILRTSGKSWQSEGLCNVVILRAAGESIAVGLDRVVGIHEAVVHPLPGVIPPMGLLLGASLDADGKATLVLDPMGLIEAHRGARWTPAPVPSAPPPRRPILVVDDSLTTRVLEQSILEASGYDVHLASSAEEALRMIQFGDYGLFIVDVEMPGMNGFEFLARTRADVRLRDVPAILVTSLAGPEERKRGQEVGAADYVVKSEFDQGRFLERVAQLAR